MAIAKQLVISDRAIARFKHANSFDATSMNLVQANIDPIGLEDVNAKLFGGNIKALNTHIVGGDEYSPNSTNDVGLQRRFGHQLKQRLIDEDIARIRAGADADLRARRGGIDGGLNAFELCAGASRRCTKAIIHNQFRAAGEIWCGKGRAGRVGQQNQEDQ